MTGLPLPLLNQRRRRAFAYRDLFAGTENPAITRAAQPGLGQRTMLGARGELLDGALRGMTQAAPAVWGESAAIGPGHARGAGTVTQLYVIPADAAADGFAGLLTGLGAVDPRTNAHGLIWENGAISVATPGLKVPIHVGLRNARPIEYVVSVVEYAQGAAVLLSTLAEDQSHGMFGPLKIPAWPQARVVHTTRQGAAPTLHPAASFLGDVGGYVNGHLVDDVRVAIGVPGLTGQDPFATMADRFGGADSTVSIGPAYTAEVGTFGLTGGEVYVVSGGGFLRVYRPSGLPDGNGTYEWDVVIPAGGASQAGGYFCRVDSNNYWRWLAPPGAFQIQTWVNGAITTILSSGYTWDPGTYRVRIHRQGAQVRADINDVPLNAGNWSTDANNSHPSGTGMGFYSLNVQTMRWRYLAATPHIVTLPARVQVGAAPGLATPGATTGQDDFGGASTSLDAHVPLAGGAWSEPFGDWSSGGGRASANRATIDGNGTLAALQDLGTPYGDFEVTVHTAAVYSTGYVRAGIILNWLSNQQYLAIRLFADPVGQALNNEVELLEIVAGAGLIQRKVNIGDVLLADGSYKLKVQRYRKSLAGRQREIVQVLVWDGAAWRPRLTHTPSISFQATKHGLYLDQSDDGSTFSGWLARAVTA